MPKKININVGAASLFKRMRSLIASYNLAYKDKGVKAESPLDNKLDEILGVVEATPKSTKKPKSEADDDKSSIKQTAKEKLAGLHQAIKNALIRFNRTTFDPKTYRNLSRSNKAPARYILVIILLAIVLALIYRNVLHQQEDLASVALYQDPLPMMVSGIAATNKQLASLQKSLAESKLLLDNVKEQFYGQFIIEDSIDDITRLFEVGNLMIVKQDIQFRSTPRLAVASPIASAKPVEEGTLFSRQSLPAAPEKPGEKSPAASKAADVAKKTTVAENANDPPELSFLSIQLDLKGKYLDYLLVRNALTRSIPSASISSEDIFVAQDKPEVEIRVMLNIPYVKK